MANEEHARGFYYPLQDEAEDIDRVLHDLVEITDDEESIDQFVKVIEVNGQPHFWFGEAGDRQKPIEVSEWELPTGDGYDWVRTSCFYTPYQQGEIYDDICSNTERQICIWFRDSYRTFSSTVPSSDEHITSVIQGFGQYREYNNYTPSPSYNFGKISKQIFNDLFTENGSITIAMEANSTSSGEDSSYYDYHYTDCYFEYDSISDCYDAYVTVNNNNIKVATLAFTGDAYNYGEINIKRYYIQGLNQGWSDQWTIPQINITLKFHPVNEDSYNFNSYIYYYGIAAKMISLYDVQSAVDIWFSDNQQNSVQSSFFTDSYWSTLSISLSTKQIVKYGIYSLGVIPKQGPSNVFYLGTMSKSGNNIIPSNEPRFQIQTEEYGGVGMGITLKTPANILLQESSLVMHNSLVIMHKGARIDMSGENETTYDGYNWDGSTFAGGHNQNDESEHALLHLHGRAMIQMDNLSMIKMGGGAYLDMSEESYLNLHDLTNIDMSGAPYIHIHGVSNRSGDGTLKYNLSTRQPEIAIDDGSVISFSGNTYGDPFHIMKGYGGIVFNNDFPSAARDVLGGPLFVANEDSFYFDGYGSAGTQHRATSGYPYPNYSANSFNELFLGTDTLDRYRDPVYEDIQSEVLMTGKCTYSAERYGKLQEIFSRSVKISKYNTIINYNGDYSSQTGNDLITYVQSHPDDKPDRFTKFYYYKADVDQTISQIVSEINSSDVEFSENSIVVNDVYNNYNIVENKFIEKGLNISDYIIEIGYTISWYWTTQSQTAMNNFIDYYYSIHGTRTLETTSVVYRQSYKKSVDDFLKTYYNTSLSQISGVDIDSSYTYISMTQAAYQEIDGYYQDYSQNFTNSSYYFTSDGQEITIKPYFSIQVKSYYINAFPRFRERAYAANSIVILGGETGSTSWIKIGGDPGENTRVLITNNANVEFSQNSQFLINGNTSFEITDNGITFTDSTGTVTFSAAELAAIIAGGQLPNAEQAQF